MPSIQKLYDKYKGQVQFVLLSNENPMEVYSYFEKEGYDLPGYLQTSNMPSSLSASSIPKTYIISKKGEIIYSKTGSAKWHGDKVSELLDNLISQ
jgi:peroxiredoxin